MCYLILNIISIELLHKTITEMCSCYIPTFAMEIVHNTNVKSTAAAATATTTDGILFPVLKILTFN